MEFAAKAQIALLSLAATFSASLNEFKIGICLVKKPKFAEIKRRTLAAVFPFKFETSYNVFSGLAHDASPVPARKPRRLAKIVAKFSPLFGRSPALSASSAAIET